VANTASAQKRVRSNERKRVRNQKVRTKTRSILRTAREALAGKGATDAKTAVMTAVSALDKAAVKGILHKKNAARRKGRLMKKLAAAAK
jgi:small subunit ribosomal protein S20